MGILGREMATPKSFTTNITRGARIILGFYISFKVSLNFCPLVKVSVSAPPSSVNVAA